MMGKDCERIVFSINKIIDVASEAIEVISNLNAPPVKVKADHSHDEHGNVSRAEFIEKESKIPMAGPLEKVINTLEDLADDLSKLNLLEEGLYTSTKSFNNSIGSPWTEVKRLKNNIDKVSNYAGEDYIGDRNVVISLLSAVISSTVDAKWAIIFYHDYLQRGFDNIFNDNNPSIAFRKNYKTDDLDIKKTLGNRNQEIPNNVHIKKDNRDPF